MKTREAFESKYKQLNKNQKKAVDSIDGPVMVVAGPGTGKTTILTLRIANILAKTDVQAENILALTFTNSGVHAMRKKLLAIIGDEAYRVNIFTFHSFCEHIINEFSFYFKEQTFFNILSDLDKVKFIEEIIKENNFKEIVNSFDPMFSLNSIRFAIDSIKNEGLSPKEFKNRIPKWKEELLSDESIYYKRKFGKYKPGDAKPSELKRIESKISKAEEIVTAYEIYQKKIDSNMLYDFNDIILNVLKELETNENLKLDLQEKYQYILVDEHQDTNDGQNRLIELLTDAEHLEDKPNVFTVGDEKQSIYRFQGASEETFNHFQKVYKDVEIITLEKNYRSSTQIIDSAHELIINTQEDAPKLESNLGNKVPVSVGEFSSYKLELLYLAEDIKKKIDSGVDLDNIAVIFRSNKTAKDIEDILSKNEIPHTILSKEDIISDPNIQNLITLLKVIENPKDNHNLGKVFLANFLGFDPYDTMDTLHDFYKQSKVKKVTLFEFIQQNNKYTDFLEILKMLKNKANNSKFTIFFKDFLELSGYLNYMLKSETSQDQLIKVDKLFDEIKRQAESKKDYNLSDFVKFVESYEKYNLRIETNDPEIMSGVKLMTSHRSKGLEFDHVYIIDVTRNNWEKSRGIPQISLPIDNYKGGIDDERRLFYVAMTRAKKHLTITSSSVDWEGRERDRSEFVQEIGEKNSENLDIKSFEENNIKSLSDFFTVSKIKRSIWDKEYMSKLFLSKNLSVSALNNYLSCPNKYLFRNLIQLPSSYTTHQVFGNIIHNTLEKFFTESKRENRFLTKRKFLNLFKETILSSSLYGYDYDRYEEKGMNILEEYYDHRKKDWILDCDLETRIEREFTLYNGKKITISGILDKIEYLNGRESGQIRIVDYKTGKPLSEKRREHRADLERQLSFYYVLLEGYKKGVFEVESTILDFIEKSKKDTFEFHSSDVSEEDIESIENDINTLAKDIFDGTILNKSCNEKHCEYCTLRSF